MKLYELIYDDEILTCNADKNTQINKVTTNPEKIDKNTLLIIPNKQKLASALSFNKPPAVIACEETEALPKEIPHIRLKNARSVLAKAFYRFYKIDTSLFKTVAITGTNGKTSTAHFIKAILKESGKKVGYIGTGIIEIDGKPINDENYSMTTPDPDNLYKTMKQMQDESCEVIVMEVSSHALSLEKVSPIVFDYAVFTNLSAEHGDFHKTIDNYFNAKCKLFRQCKTGIFNIDDSYARQALSASYAKNNLTVGVIHKGNVYATHVENNGLSGSSFMYHADGFLFKMNVRVPGIYNVYNSMLAVAVCIDMGCRPCIAKQAVFKLNSIPGRFDVTKSDVTVIVDYAHTDAALEAFLREAKRIAGKKALTTIFGCGGERDTSKRPKMAAIAERFSDTVTVTSDNPRNEDPSKIIKDITKGFKKANHKIIPDRRAAIEYSIKNASSGDVIAVIGKGAEKYIIDKDGYHSFDEKQIIENALKERLVQAKCESV